ncbi:hypothetical protein N9Y31_00960 [Alphaproteobacteria bacterium]|nr:hypothetical protein [Alphaproteobacteria bacterium]
MEAISGVRKAFSIKPGYCFRAYLGSQCLALRKRIIIKQQSCDKFSVICEQKNRWSSGNCGFLFSHAMPTPFLNGSDVSLCAVAAPGKTGRAIMMMHKKSGFFRPFIV